MTKKCQTYLRDRGAVNKPLTGSTDVAPVVILASITPHPSLIKNRELQRKALQRTY